MTGLPTRSLFLDRLQQACEEAQRKHQLVAVILVNLKRFKQVNETLGLVAGDLLLQHAAARLSRTASTTVARLGGDEYALLFNAEDENDITLKAQAIIDHFAQPFSISEVALFVGVNAGIAVFPNDGSDPEILLRNAAVALHRSRSNGSMVFHFYATGMNERALERLTLEEAMHHGLERDQFVLHYQPQVSRSGELICLEALLRWQHPTLGLLPPAEFIPIAEESGFIVAIGEWVIRQVCDQYNRWKESGLRVVPIAVNVSPHQFGPRLIPQVRRILEETGTPGSALEFEITETVLMRNAEASRATLLELNALGIRFAIDDFGTGYSSLNYLKRFPIDVLKIDRSFVIGIPQVKQDSGIAAAIITLAHNLGMLVIAEGVETQTQLDFLYAHGCDGIQGFNYSRALAPAETALWLAEVKPFKPFR